jgi:hypothetical protein
VVRASLAPPCVVLEELEEMTNPSSATLTWPDFPEMQGRGPMGPVHLMGVDLKGELLLWKEEVPADTVRALLQGRSQGTGYLTIMRGSYALYDVMTDDYVWLDSVTKPLDLTGPRIQRGHQTLERVQKSWFVAPTEGGPVKTKPLPRPYGYEQCWLGANGQALFDVRALSSFLNNHIGTIGDPYAWKEQAPKPSGGGQGFAMKTFGGGGGLLGQVMASAMAGAMGGADEPRGRICVLGEES